MLITNPVKAQYYDQMLTLNGQNQMCQSQVSSREKLKVRDVINDPYITKKSQKEKGLS